MGTTKESNRHHWIYFTISFIICVLLLTWLPAFFWISLPFVLTFLVKALGVI